MIHSDVQFPLHDARAVELMMKVTKFIKPDVITNIGDLSNQVEAEKVFDPSHREA